MKLAGSGVATTAVLTACGRVPIAIPTSPTDSPPPYFERSSERISEGKVIFSKDGRMYVKDEEKYEPFFMRQLHGSVGTPQGAEGWKNAKEIGANVVTMCFIDDNNMTQIKEAGLKATIQFEYLFPDLKYNPQVMRDFMQKHGDTVIGFSLDEPSTDRPTPGWEPDNIKKLIDDFSKDRVFYGLVTIRK